MSLRCFHVVFKNRHDGGVKKMFINIPPVPPRPSKKWDIISRDYELPESLKKKPRFKVLKLGDRYPQVFMGGTGWNSKTQTLHDGRKTAVCTQLSLLEGPFPEGFGP